jgi:hypothetical protein
MSDDKGKIGRVRLEVRNKVVADDGTEGRITSVSRSPKPGETHVVVEDADGNLTDHKSRNLRNQK